MVIGQRAVRQPRSFSGRPPLAYCGDASQTILTCADSCLGATLPLPKTAYKGSKCVYVAFYGTIGNGAASLPPKPDTTQRTPSTTTQPVHPTTHTSRPDIHLTPS
ncbi:hypothetical protein E2C01_055893 [Portunus trituberculatus]|uniref:Uncharacterized protein n=1 Tax=Portunus trituberculatus TaxID=210409 RepID=A0A5B7GVY3_PORTR|nr:hypothetical protein [Portunus trituberculatus]